MCKPKNRVMCPDCGREKLLFENESKAQRFIDFNWEELTDDKDKLRIYYCPACCGYHISSHKYNGDGKNTERLIKRCNDSLRKPFTQIDEEYLKVRDKCLTEKFNNRKEFLEYVKQLEVSTYKVRHKLISYFDLHPIW